MRPLGDDTMEDDKEILEIRERKMKEFVDKQRFPDKPMKVGDDDFEGFIKKYPVVVVDFWSISCPPCRMIEPIIEELAKELKGEVVFGKVCIDEHRKAATMFRIAAIPTLLVFSKGELVDTIVGLAPKEVLLEKIRKCME
jgi:thioredoxin 1